MIKDVESNSTRRPVFNSLICKTASGEKTSADYLALSTRDRKHRVLTSRAGSQRHHNTVHFLRREPIFLQEVKFGTSRLRQFFHRFFDRPYVLTHPEVRMRQYQSDSDISFLVFPVTMMMGTRTATTTPS